jgi:very-short-patch-repair endonuclease
VTEPARPRKKHTSLGAPDATIRLARALRKEMTLPEVLLWQQLKQQPGGYRFRKQHPLGPYVLDFACIRARLAIEVDGEAHNRGDQPERDAARDAFVLGAGFKTVRIPATEVRQRMPPTRPPLSSPERGGGAAEP